MQNRFKGILHNWLCIYKIIAILQKIIAINSKISKSYVAKNCKKAIAKWTQRYQNLT